MGRSTQVCKVCQHAEAHAPSCPELRWPDGRLRGANPGTPPAKLLTLQDEMTGIFRGVTEAAVRSHLEARGLLAPVVEVFADEVL